MRRVYIVPRSTMRAILALALLLSVALHAQIPPIGSMDQPFHFGPALYESPEDSAAFVQFREGLSFDVPHTALATSPYRLLWRESEQGGLHIVIQGDGSKIMTLRGNASIDELILYDPFRTADGRPGILVSYERPCALICRTTSYYLVDEGEDAPAIPPGSSPAQRLNWE